MAEVKILLYISLTILALTVRGVGGWGLRNPSAQCLPRQPVNLVLKYQLSATGGPWKDF